MYLLKNKLEQTPASLKKYNNLVQDCTGTVSHDIKMPLVPVILTSDIFKKKYEGLQDTPKKNI